MSRFVFHRLTYLRLTSQTNIPFLIRLLTHPVFESGKTWTTFIDDTPDLFKLMTSQNRAQKLLAYLGDVAVNGSSIKGQAGEPGLSEDAVIPQFKDREDPAKPLDVSQPCQTGWRNIILKEGPEGFAKAVRAYPGTVSSVLLLEIELTNASSSWTRPGVTLTSRSWRLVFVLLTWPTSPRRLLTLSPTPIHSSAGEVPPSTSPCASCTRTLGTDW